MLSIAGRTHPIAADVYLDANFVIDVYADGTRWHDAARLVWEALMGEVARGRATAFCSALVADECLWGLTIALYERRHGSGTWSAQGEGEKDEALHSFWPQLTVFVTDLLRQTWLTFVDVTRDDIGPAFQDMRALELRPRDAFHAALAKRHGASCIMTRDARFASALTDDPDLQAFDFSRVPVPPRPP